MSEEYMESNDFEDAEVELFIMEDGPQKMEALSNYIRRADEQGDTFYSLYFRFRYAAQATFHDDPTKAITAASEFASIFEQHREQMEKRKGMVEAYMGITEMGIEPIVNLPQISRAQWEKMMDGYLALVNRYHLGTRSYWWQMGQFYIYIDKDRAFSCFEKFWNAERDAVSDCSACECSNAVYMYLMHGDRAAADNYREELLAGKYETCSVAEPKMHLYYLQDALRHGNLKEAAVEADHIRDFAKENKSHLEFLSGVLQCYAYTKPEAAVKLVEEYLEWGMKIFQIKWKYDFYKAAYVTFHELMGSQKTVKLKLPEQIPFWNEKGEYHTEELAEYFYGQAQGLAKRFDARNGSDYFLRDLSDTKSVMY